MTDNKTTEKYKWLFLVVLTLVLLSFFFFIRNRFQSNQILNIEDLTLTKIQYFKDYQSEYQKISDSFEKIFLKGTLPITNLKTVDVENLASGEDILSESLGLMMFIALKEEDLNQFNKLVVEMDRSFLKENGLLKWRVRDNLENEETVNASIDDLRVIKALYEASEKWEEPIFKAKAIELGKSLYEHCVRKDFLTSFDVPDSPLAILTYYDFKAILYLSNDNKQWEKVLKNGLQKVYGDKVDKKPFYDLDRSTSSYKSIENLLILQHLYEVGIKDDLAIQFIKEELGKGGYYASYSKQGNIVSQIESPSIYGIIAQIAQLSDDMELYRAASEKMISMTNKVDAQYNWAFVDPNTHIGFSFDHLMVLLGL